MSRLSVQVRSSAPVKEQIMVINELKQKIQDYARGLTGTGSNLNSLTVEEPKNEKFGDLSTNAAMVLAPILMKNPFETASKVEKELISKWDQIKDINIVKPGFINFNLKDEFIKENLKTILESKEKSGSNRSGEGIKEQLEYVSSNPADDEVIVHLMRGPARRETLC